MTDEEEKGEEEEFQDEEGALSSGAEDTILSTNDDKDDTFRHGLHKECRVRVSAPRASTLSSFLREATVALKLSKDKYHGFPLSVDLIAK